MEEKSTASVIIHTQVDSIRKLETHWRMAKHEKDEVLNVPWFHKRNICIFTLFAYRTAVKGENQLLIIKISTKRCYENL